MGKGGGGFFPGWAKTIFFVGKRSEMGRCLRLREGLGAGKTTGTAFELRYWG